MHKFEDAASLLLIIQNLSLVYANYWQFVYRPHLIIDRSHLVYILDHNWVNLRLKQSGSYLACLLVIQLVVIPIALKFLSGGMIY